MIGGNMMTEIMEVDRKLVIMIYEATKDKLFSKKIVMSLHSVEQKAALIDFIVRESPSLNEINHKALEIALSN